MNMKKLLAGVVGVTVLMSNVAFAAVSTTTTYNATTGKVDVSTYVTELTSGSMVTYVLYGNKDKDTTPFAESNGAITPTTATAPDEANIIYIDQENSVTGTTKTFTAPGLNVGEAYGAKVIVGTDNDTDAGDVAVTENYTGDMYTLKLAENATDYKATVEVLMETEYPMIYTLDDTDDRVQVPVSANCKVTFEATASGKKISSCTIDGETFANAGNLNTGSYKEGEEHVLSAVVENQVAAPLITVSDPIIGTNTVSYLVNVEYFDAMNTGLKIDFVDYPSETVLHEFDKLVPYYFADDKNCYAIRIIDKTDGGLLNIVNDTNYYKVTPFIKVGDDYIYAGSTSSGDANHFTVGKDSTLSDAAEDSNETQPEEPTDETTDESSEESTEEPADETVVEE